MVNAHGKRFVDESPHFRNYTYAKYGEIIANQPKGFAWQVFDAKSKDLLRDEYRIREVTKVSANTLEELAAKLEGVNAEQFLRTVAEFNAAVPDTPEFNPNILDGRRTVGLDIVKSNWSQKLDTPPYDAYAVACGVTFTFGGLRINSNAEVISTDGGVIPNLYAAGEIVGGLFYYNYPSGSGITAGAVIGRIAGTSATSS
jgi:tricarballylate dehydrogenase